MENLVRRLAALYPQEEIGAEVIDAELTDLTLPPTATSGESLSEAVERHLRTYFAAHKGGVPAAGLYDRLIREIERPLLQLSLAATRGNQVRAAELLGLNRNTLRKKLRALDIDVVRGLK
jgi:two-component system nitrogen regulation response regulator GlnG